MEEKTTLGSQPSDGSPHVENKTDEVLITRLFNAPREKVFEAWIKPEILVKWYAPKSCSIRFSEINVNEGGSFHSCITTPDGYECWCKGTYHEIVEAERLVFSMAVSDEHGNLITAAEAGMDPEWPTETRVTVTFDDVNGQTKLKLYQTVSESLAKRTGAYPSWLQMLDILESQLAA